MPAWHEEPIGKAHDREAFDCGEEALNEFFRRYARKSHELGGAKTFLAIDDADRKTILGFYSLSPASVNYARTPETGVSAARNDGQEPDLVPVAERGIVRDDLVAAGDDPIVGAHVERLEEVESDGSCFQSDGLVDLSPWEGFDLDLHLNLSQKIQ